MTPVVELELKSTTGQEEEACVVPEGILLELRHCLKVPRIRPVGVFINNEGQIYHLVKITKVNGEYVKEIIDTKTVVTSAYFGSESLVGKPLCNFVWIAIRQVTNMHVLPRRIIVTRHEQTCAHSASMLSAYAFCNCGNDESVMNLISPARQRKTDAFTEVLIEQRDELTIKVKEGEGEWFQLQETVTNLKLCKFNGGFRLGHFKPSFKCTCATENEPCKGPRELEITSTTVTSVSQRSLGFSSSVALGMTFFTGCILAPLLKLPFIYGATIFIPTAIALALMPQEESGLVVSKPPIHCSLDLGCDCTAQICEYDGMLDSSVLNYSSSQTCTPCSHLKIPQLCLPVMQVREQGVQQRMTGMA